MVPPERPTIWVPRNRNVSAARREGVDLRWGNLSQAELAQRVTEKVKTVIDCARFLSRDEALRVADSALHHGDVSQEELVRAALAGPRSGRGRALDVANAADGRAASTSETLLRRICSTIPGLDVEPQVQVGSIGCADLVDANRRLVIEAESMAHHGTRTGYRRDVRRYTSMVAERHLVLRFCWEDVMFEEQEVRAPIASVLTWWPPADERAVGHDPS